MAFRQVLTNQSINQLRCKSRKADLRLTPPFANSAINLRLDWFGSINQSQCGSRQHAFNRNYDDKVNKTLSLHGHSLIEFNIVYHSYLPFIIIYPAPVHRSKRAYEKDEPINSSIGGVTLFSLHSTTIAPFSSCHRSENPITQSLSATTCYSTWNL